MCVLSTVLVEVRELSGITSLSNVSSGDGSETIKFSEICFYPLCRLTPPVSGFCVGPWDLNSGPHMCRHFTHRTICKDQKIPLGFKS